MADKYGGPIAEPSLVDATGKPGGLGEKIESTLQRAFAKLIGGVANTLADILRAGVIAALHALFPGTRELFDGIYAMLLDLESTPPEVKEAIREAQKGEHEADPVTLLLGGIGMLVGLAIGSLGPITRRMSYEVDQRVKTARASPDLGTRLLWRGLWDKQRFITQTQDLGWGAEDAERLIEALREKPGIGDVAAAFYRGYISEDEFLQRVQELGFGNEDAELLLKLSERIPPITDIIRFAVREAFDEAVIEKFGYMQNFPSEVAQWARAQGFSEDWARKYWAAHWELPSITMGFEMFQRTTESSTDPDADTIPLPSGRNVQNVIGRSTLEMLLRIADIAPFWRDKIMEVAYRPYNRVDVRRMYRLGVLDIDDVYRAYLDIGYPPERAAALTEWTVLEYGEGGRDLTKTDILIAYRQRRIVRDTALNMLIEIGYDQKEAELLIGREDYKLEEEKEKAIIKVIKLQYLMNQIDRGQVWSELGKLDLPDERVRLLLEMWDVEKRKKSKRPTPRELIGFFERGIISEEEFVAEMSNYGYTDKYIDWYLKSLRG